MWQLTLIFLLSWSVTPIARAQVTYEPIASDETAKIEEVEDLPDSDGPPSALIQGAEPQNDGRFQFEELSFSQEELRSRYKYLLALTLGSAKPWHGYSLEMGSVVGKDRTLSLIVGGGRFESAEYIEENSYEVRGKSRSLALVGRWYSSHVGNIGLESVLGYALWQGMLDPQSSEDEETLQKDKLSSGFEGSGAYLGLAWVVTWIWDSGFFLDWIPLGMQVSKLMTFEYARDEHVMGDAARRTIEKPKIYGLINIKLGYLLK